jgi:hypothetical protein
MTVEQTDILNGVESYATKNSDFNTAIGGGANTPGRLRYAKARRNETRPYVTYISVDMLAADSFEDDGFDARIQFSIYGRESAGPEGVCSIADKLRARMNGAKLSISDHRAYAMEEIDTRGPLFDDEAWRVDVDFSLRGLTS